MKKMMILFGVALLIFISFSSALANPAADPVAGTTVQITLQPDNKQYQVGAQEFTMSVPPVNVGGRIFVPLDFLGSVLGAADDPASWRVSSGAVELLVPSSDGGFLKIEMQDTSRQLTLTYLNNKTEEPAAEAEQSKIITMDVTPLVKGGQIYLPVRWVAEACGFTVTWDSVTQKALLTAPGKGTVSEAGKNTNGEAGGNLPGGVKINSQEIKDSSPQMELDLQMPTITGLGDPALQKRINKEIMDKAMQTKAELEQSYAELAKGAEASGFPLHTFQFFVRYRNYACGDILSLAVESYQYSGGAHGGTTVDFYNLDTKNNKLLTLPDLFRDNVDYIPIINQEIKKQIAGQQENAEIPYFTGENGFQSIDAKHPFYVKDNALVLHFGQYEIAPYAAGMPEFAIPLTSLAEYLQGGSLLPPKRLTQPQKPLLSPEKHITNDFYASVYYLPENDLLSFTIPEKIPEGYKFYLHVSGRLLMEDSSSGMSFHAFEHESEDFGWINGKTYTYPLKSGSLDECLLVFGLIDKNGQELLSTVYVYPDGTKKIEGR